MRSLLRDARFAIRSLGRRRTFALVAVTTLGLGVGAATSIYSVVDGILLKPLPYRDADRLVAVWQTYPHWRNDPILALSWDRITFSYSEFRNWRASQRSFDDVAIWTQGNTRIGSGETLESVQLTEASASIANVLQIRPAVGRFYTAAEDVVGGPPLVVLSYENWMSRYGGDPRVVGTSVRFSRGTYTIVGVLPAGVSLDHGVPASPYWIPIGQDSTRVARRQDHSNRAIGRLKVGVTATVAAQELDRLNDVEPHWNEHGAVARTWQVDLTRNVRKPLLLLMGAVLVLMLIACVNVATLLLGEAVAREHEMAARVALGASRMRLLRQLLTESGVLGMAAALLGVVLALGGTKVLVALAPPSMTGITNVHVDLRVLTFALALAVVTGMLFGLAPAVALARKDPASLLRGASGGRAHTGHTGLQPLFVAVQLALSFVLLVGAGLLTRSLLRISAVNPGFDRENLYLAQVSIPRRDSLALYDFHVRASQRLAVLPGVVTATATSHVPFSNSWSSSSFRNEGDADAPERTHEAQQRVVLPGFFRMMGIPLVAGRDLTAADGPGSPRVLVINQTMAKHWPDGTALGRRIRYQGQVWEIVGVVGDVRHRKLSSEVEATLYAAHAQRPATNMTFLLRTRAGTASMTHPVRAALRELDASVLLTRVDAIPDLVRRSYAEERYRSALIVLFGVIAVLLAAAGVYGVVSRTVGQRMRELGIRMALGATPRAVMRLVVETTSVGVGVGITAGVAAALLGRDYIAGFLFEVPGFDLTTYVGVVAILGAVSLIASWLPARRAAAVDPAIVLREQ